jgi:hypothetical protein
MDEKDEGGVHGGHIHQDLPHFRRRIRMPAELRVRPLTLGDEVDSVRALAKLRENPTLEKQGDFQ